MRTLWKEKFSYQKILQLFKLKIKLARVFSKHCFGCKKIEKANQVLSSNNSGQGVLGPFEMADLPSDSEKDLRFPEHAGEMESFGLKFSI